jgi:hypothetical protein
MALVADLFVAISVLGFVLALVAGARNALLARNLAVASAFLLVAGAAFGGLAFAGIPAFIDIEAPTTPAGTASPLFNVRIASSSTTDRNPSGEVISADGKTIRWTMSNSEMSGLGDITLDVEVVNVNAGEPTNSYPFTADLVFLASTGTPAMPILNKSASGINLYDWSGAETVTGAPTFSFSNTGGSGMDSGLLSSGNFVTGGSDIIQLSFRVNPTAMASWTPDMALALELLIGGHTVQVLLSEA